MKKIAFLVCGVLVLGFTSCKKECTCTSTIDGEVITTTTDEASSCSSLDREDTVLGSTVKVTCK